MDLNEVSNTLVFSFVDLVTGKCFFNALDLSDASVGRASLKALAVAVAVGIISATGVLKLGIIWIALIPFSSLWTFSAAIKMDSMNKVMNSQLDRMSSSFNEKSKGFDSALFLGRTTKSAILKANDYSMRASHWVIDHLPEGVVNWLNNQVLEDEAIDKESKDNSGLERKS